MPATRGDLYSGVSLQRLQVFVAVADHGGFSARRGLSRPWSTDYLIPYQSSRAVVRGAVVGVSRASRAPHSRRSGAVYRSHPGLQLSLEFGHSVRLAEAVHEKNLDLAYVVNWRLPAGARYTPLHSAEFVRMVAPDHPLASGQSVTQDEIYEAGLITAPIFSQEWPHYEHLLRSYGLERYRVGLEIDGVQPRLTATQAGLGVMGVFVPPYAVENLAALLRPLPLASAAPKVEFGIVLPPQQSRPLRPSNLLSGLAWSARKRRWRPDHCRLRLGIRNLRNICAPG